MIVVKVEIWPRGHSEFRRELASAHIINDGTGTATRGNYLIKLFNRRGALWRTGRLTGFARKRFLALDLLMLCLVAVLGGRHTHGAKEEAIELKESVHDHEDLPPDTRSDPVVNS